MTVTRDDRIPASAAHHHRGLPGHPAQPGRARRLDQRGDGQNHPGGPNPQPGHRQLTVDRRRHAPHTAPAASGCAQSARPPAVTVVTATTGPRAASALGLCCRAWPRPARRRFSSPSSSPRRDCCARPRRAPTRNRRPRMSRKQRRQPRRRPPPPSRSPTHASAPATSSTTCWCAATTRPTSRSSSPRPRPWAWCRGPRSTPPTRASRRCATGCSRSGYFLDVRLSVTRGAARGGVVLVVEVEERGTIVINELFPSTSAATTFWGGADVSETNFLGRGINLGARVRRLDDAGGAGRHARAGPAAARRRPAHRRSLRPQPVGHRPLQRRQRVLPGGRRRRRFQSAQLRRVTRQARGRRAGRRQGFPVARCTRASTSARRR